MYPQLTLLKMYSKRHQIDATYFRKVATFQIYSKTAHIRKLYTYTNLHTKREDIILDRRYNDNNVYNVIADPGLEIRTPLMNLNTLAEYRCGCTLPDTPILRHRCSGTTSISLNKHLNLARRENRKDTSYEKPIVDCRPLNGKLTKKHVQKWQSLYG